MKRMWSLMLVLLLGVCLIRAGGCAAPTIDRSVPLEGETRRARIPRKGPREVLDLHRDGIYEACRTTTQTIQQ
jgi:hypothetical protein